MGDHSETWRRQTSGLVAPRVAESADPLVVAVCWLAGLCVLAVEWRAHRVRRSTQRGWIESNVRDGNQADRIADSPSRGVPLADTGVVRRKLELSGTPTERTQCPPVRREAPSPEAAKAKKAVVQA
jgi:hypothetical protein